MKSIINLVGLLKLVNKKMQRHEQARKYTGQSHISIMDITKNDTKQQSLNSHRSKEKAQRRLYLED